MTSRHVKCSRQACGAIWRMAQIHIDRALGVEGLSCPVCRAPAGAESAADLTEAERSGIHAICDRIAAEAAADINREEERRRATLQRERVHAIVIRACARQGVTDAS